MKVLDLACANQHLFEGWFASEDDFVAQCARRLVECPVCGDAEVSKKLSAPRLNLGAGLPEDIRIAALDFLVGEIDDAAGGDALLAAQAAHAARAAGSAAYNEMRAARRA